MHWTAIKLHLLPLIMQEIEVCEKNYIDLINKIKLKKTKENIEEYFDMRTSISARIEELENYFDENFGNIRMNILQKGIFILKRCLFYNPDKNNDLDEPDLDEFTGLVMDFHLIQKNNFEFQGFSKNLKQSNIKPVDRATLRATLRNNKAQGNLRKSAINGGRDSNMNALNRRTMGIRGGEIQENQALEDENDDEFGSNIITKKLRIRLTDEEYRLLQKLKAKRNHAQ